MNSLLKVNNSYFIPNAPVGQSSSRGKDNKINVSKKDEQTIQAILSENNQVIRKVPQGQNSLYRAFSYAFYFTTNHAEHIQSRCCEFLRTLIQKNEIPKRLNIFQNNISLFRDFCINPHFVGFDKINLELLSLLHKVRIVVYTISDDLYLHSMTINNGFDKTLEFLRMGHHYDVLDSFQYMEKLKICQNMVYELLEEKLGFRKKSCDDFYNLEYNSAQQMTSSQEKSQKPRHKKSLSDNYNVSHAQIHEQEDKYYNMFTNPKPPEDFVKLLSKKESQEFQVISNPGPIINTPDHSTSVTGAPGSTNETFSSSFSSILGFKRSSNPPIPTFNQQLFPQIPMQQNISQNQVPPPQHSIKRKLHLK